MKIQQLEIENFKRFTKLKVDLGDMNKRLVVLIGPNGCGKSSIFDAFEQIGGKNKPGFQQDESYLKKDPNQEFKIRITSDKGELKNSQTTPKTYFYLRSPYRHDPDFRSNQIGQKQDVTEDDIRPKRMIDVDRRVQDNYDRLVGETTSALYKGNKDHLSVSGLREELIGRVKTSMSRVFDDLMLEGVGEPFIDGQFFFKKGSVNHFPYKNLSAGEKGAFDLLLDLLMKTVKFNDTIIAIDEPELHMHSKLQKELLKEMYSLIPENCQLWIATHSIGFIRESINLCRADQDKVAMLNFSNLDFDQEQIIIPFSPNNKKIQEIFSVAIDDLASMVTPSKVMVCEGSINAPVTSGKKDFDTNIYNTIFENDDVLFISGDNKTIARESGKLLLKIIEQSGSIRESYSLVDRDNLTPEKISEYQASDPTQKFLARKEIENYLLDPEIIKKYCSINGKDYGTITTALTDVINDDAKSLQGAIATQCGYVGTVDNFKKELAKIISADTELYKTLKADIGL
ncbi:MAG: ATP-binding protein [Candidatus Paceibacterota bacterium]|jgi:hypothetical protein|nr:ATP-binding protein [bacterium]